MSFCVGDEKLLEKYKAIWAKVEDLKNRIICFTSLWWQIYKTGTYCDKVYTDFRSLNVPEDYIEWKSFRVISIASVLLYGN